MTSGPFAWDPVMARLSAEREVLALALPGHWGGAPVPDAGSFTVETMVDLVADEIDRLGLGQVDLVGNSLGGWIALRLAERGYARSVVCLAPAGGWRPRGAFEWFLLARFAVGYWVARVLCLPGGWRIARTPLVRRVLLHAMVARPERISFRDTMRVIRSVAECKALVGLLRRPTGIRMTAPRVDVPVLVAWSEKDRILISSRARATFMSWLPGAAEVVLPGVGHVPMSDAPELVARTILDFIDPLAHGRVAS
jgi:pimeloyl-ACP methyl ester carboxylesterase